jgi:hypothetical protein
MAYSASAPRALQPASTVTRARARWLLACGAFALTAAACALVALALAPQQARRAAYPPRDACLGDRPPSVHDASLRVGAYYYDGWSGPLDARQFDGLLDQPWAGRQPLYGWQDRTSASMAQQLRWARNYGIRFFAFDWYYGSDPATAALNGALSLYQGLSSHSGVGYALVYVNTGGRVSFVVPTSRWPDVVSQWATQNFTDPAYERVGGKPLLVILDVASFNRQFGGSAGADAAIATLRRAAVKAGLPGVYVVGGVYVDPRFDWNWFRLVASKEDFDGFTQYSAPAAAGVSTGPRPYTRLVHAIEADWSRFAAGPKPFVPDVVTGWDPRPWGSTVNGKLWWFRRTPAQVRDFAEAAVRFAGRQAVRSDVSQPPLMFVEAWNELGEGAYVVPTVGSCHQYGAALAAAVTASR